MSSTKLWSDKSTRSAFWEVIKFGRGSDFFSLSEHLKWQKFHFPTYYTLSRAITGLPLALARWIVKVSLPEVNQFTGNCFRVVRIVLKITQISRPTPLDSPSVLLWLLTLSNAYFAGTAGDSLGLHRGYAFTTKDQDNDTWSKNCASHFKGAWWYTDCHISNLNGVYLHGKHSKSWQGMVWNTWKGANYSVKRAEMKIRPVKA